MAQQKKKSTRNTKSSTRRSTSNTSAAKTNKKPAPKRSNRGIYALVLFVLGVFTFLSYFNNDGVVIKLLRQLLSGLFGGGFYLVPPVLIVAAVLLAFSEKESACGKAVYALLIPVMAAAFCQLFSRSSYDLSFGMFKYLWNDGTVLSGGGAIGGAITILFSFLFSKTGAAIVFVCLAAMIILALFGLTVPAIIELLKEQHENAKNEREAEDAEDEYIDQKHRRTEPIKEEKPAQPAANHRRSAIDIPLDEPNGGIEPEEKPKKPSLFNKKPAAPAPDTVYGGSGVEQPTEPEKPEPVTVVPEPVPQPEIKPIPTTPVYTPAAEPKKPVTVPAPEPIKAEIAPVDEITSLIEESAKRDIAEALQTYKFPDTSLLSRPVNSGKKDSETEISATKERLEMTLRSFGINAEISNVVNGPSITRYEMELEIGVKLNKLTSLADDIALSLGVSGVRIAAIPNKISTVGIEVPNKNVSTVFLREIIESSEFRSAKSKLTFAIGKNIAGDIMVGNISKLPHLLVAGTTGSGKSVCLNSLILSLMYKASPEEIKFIMIDPKMVEFKIYNGIPHLLIPVVTEAKKAAGALQWAVTEMMKRYRLFSDAGARDIATYNELIKDADTPQMPQIVVIIDELADLMLVAAKEVEESICRVAQMGRAAGVHLVIATQSPRADVITGLMKANIPSRIAFKVASSLESRIILDAGGSADKLVGNGDMLFAPIGTSKPTRIQGTWVSDEEREQVVEFVKSQSEASYAEDVIHAIDSAVAEKEGKQQETKESKAKEYDELLPQAADVIFDTNQASVSMLQRRLKLGYARAARLVDQLEEIGIVGPFEGSKPRQILITRQQWQEMQFLNGTAPIGTAAPTTEDTEFPSAPANGVVSQNMYSADDLFDNEEE